MRQILAGPRLARHKVSSVTSPSAQKPLASIGVPGAENSNECWEFASASHPCPFYWFVPWVHRPTAAGDLVAHHRGLFYSGVVVLLWLMLFLV